MKAYWESFIKYLEQSAIDDSEWGGYEYANHFLEFILDIEVPPHFQEDVRIIIFKLKNRINDLEAERYNLFCEVKDLEQKISESPRCDTIVNPSLQRMWESCTTLSEKAEFKNIMRYIQTLEQRINDKIQTL